MATNRFIQRQNWMQAHKSVKRRNAAARLYSAWQWDRYLVPQNVFLVDDSIKEKYPLKSR